MIFVENHLDCMGTGIPLYGVINLGKVKIGSRRDGPSLLFFDIAIFVDPKYYCISDADIVGSKVYF